MKRTEVESSNIKSIGYYEAENILEVEFLTGKVYIYLYVPKDVHEAFMGAESQGKYFHKVIRNDERFAYFDVTDHEPNVEGDAKMIANLCRVEPLPLFLADDLSWEEGELAEFITVRMLWLRLQPVQYIMDVILRGQELTGKVNFAYVGLEKKSDGPEENGN